MNNVSFSLVCQNDSNPRVPEIRYDMQSDISQLDGESQLALLDLGVKWSERNAALQFDLAPFEALDDLDEGWSCLSPTVLAEQPFPLTRKITR